MAEKHETLRIEAELDLKGLDKEAKKSGKNVEQAFNQVEKSAKSAQKAIDSASKSLGNLSETSKSTSKIGSLGKTVESASDMSLAMAAVAGNTKQAKKETDRLTASELVLASSIQKTTSKSTEYLNKLGELRMKYGYLDIMKMAEDKKSGLPEAQERLASYRREVEKLDRSHSTLNGNLDETRKSLKLIGGLMSANQLLGSGYEFIKNASGNKDNWRTGDTVASAISHGLGSAMTGGIAAGMAFGSGAGPYGAVIGGFIGAGNALMTAAQELKDAARMEMESQLAKGDSIAYDVQRDQRNRLLADSFEEFKALTKDEADAKLTEMESRLADAKARLDEANRLWNANKYGGLGGPTSNEELANMANELGSANQLYKELNAQYLKMLAVYEAKEEAERKQQELIENEIKARQDIVKGIRDEDALVAELEKIEKKILDEYKTLDKDSILKKYADEVEKAKQTMESTTDNSEAFEQAQKELEKAIRRREKVEDALAEVEKKEEEDNRAHRRTMYEAASSRLQKERDEMNKNVRSRDYWANVMNQPLTNTWNRIGAAAGTYDGINKSIDLKVGQLVNYFQKEIDLTQKLIDSSESEIALWK